MNRIVAWISVPLCAAFGLSLGLVGVYVLLPLDRVGEAFSTFALRLPNDGVVFRVHMCVWVFVALLATGAGWLLINARQPSSKAAVFSRRRVLEACLMAFGATAGLTWVFAILFSLGIYRVVPDAKSSSWDFSLWVLSFAGWSAFLLSIGLRIYDQTQSRLSAQLTRP